MNLNLTRIAFLLALFSLALVWVGCTDAINSQEAATRAKVEKVKADQRALTKALEAYYLDNARPRAGAKSSAKPTSPTQSQTNRTSETLRQSKP